MNNNTMPASEKLEYIADFSLNQVKGNILPYWMKYLPDNQQGGFYGTIDQNNEADPTANKGVILNTRILWTFSYAARVYENKDYAVIANRAYHYILRYFYDNENKGFFWNLRSDGTPAETKKQIYAQAYAVYALSEFYRLAPVPQALDLALETYRLIEEHAFDSKAGGYFEAFGKEWQTMDDLRLSEKDMNEKKTMNTNLHVLEAYTNLYRVWPDDSLRLKIAALLDVFYNKIYNKSTEHLGLFFDENWTSKTDHISPGHDIEGAWLLLEAAEVIKDKALEDKLVKLALSIADKCSAYINDKGGMVYTGQEGVEAHATDSDWWVQAEAAVGFLTAHRLSKAEKYLNITYSIINYINNYLVDHENGEWHYGVDNNGIPFPGNVKAGFWKCPYHNARMCYELIAMANNLLARQPD